MFGGQTVGRALSGAAAGVGLQYFGSQGTFLFFLPIILLITLYVVFLRERPGEKRFPWSEGTASPVNLDRHVGAWLPIFMTTLKSLIKVDSLKLLSAAALSRCAAGFFDTMWPIIGGVAFVGLTTAQYSGMVSTVDLLMAVVAIGVGSFLTSRFGPRRASVLVYFSYAAMALFIFYGQSIWLSTTAFVVLSAVWSLHSTCASICTNPLRMQLSEPEVAATQFTIYNSLSNLPVSIGATVFALLGGADELATVMWLAAILFVSGALLYAWMQIGSRPAVGEPAPEFN